MSDNLDGLLKSLDDITKLGSIIRQNRKDKHFDEALINYEKIIQIAKKINRDDLVDRHSKLKEEIEKEREKFREYDELLKQIENLDKVINQNLENKRFDDALSNCDNIIQIAESINKKDFIDKYTKLKVKINKEALKFQKKKKPIEKPKTTEKIVVPSSSMPNTWIILCILGGLLLIISFIGDIAILFINLYILIVFGMGTTSGNALIIILFVLESIAIGGGLLIIIGALIIRSKYRVGKICIGTGLLIDLIGLLIFLRIGLIVAELYTSFIKLTVVLIIVCFIIGLIGLLLVAFFLIKLIRLGRISE